MLELIPFRGPEVDVKFGFVVKHRAKWPIPILYGGFGVSRNGFDVWLGRVPNTRARAGGRCPGSAVFVATAPNQKWVSEFAYLWTA